jgi:hypothetical protein
VERKSGRRSGVTWDELCELALALPRVAKSTSYGTPAVKVDGELIARLREDGETVALRMGFIERDELMGSDPATFFITDHYLKYPAVCVRLGSVRRSVLQRLLKETWGWVAPKARVAPKRRADRKRAAQ